MKRFAACLALLVLSPLCRAQTWAEVKQGAFAVPKESLVQIQATLEQRVAASTHFGTTPPHPWRNYLIQYQGATIRGRRAIEIHGSCRFDDAKFDSRSAFYDERVSDGGDCYFMVYFLIKTKRYSNVTFHGLA